MSQTPSRLPRARAGTRGAGRGIGLLRCGITLAAAFFLAGCNLTPTRPDAIFTVYRDRMKAENIEAARTLLSDESRQIAGDLESTYKLRQPPEDLALLNALDPISAPTIVESSDTLTLLQLRTMKGGIRLVRVARKDTSSPWKIDMAEQLNSLRSFLEARRALETVREQAGEFAATWKAFSDRLGKMPAPEPAPAIIAPPKSPPKPPVGKKQKKSPDHKKPTQ